MAITEPTATDIAGDGSVYLVTWPLVTAATDGREFKFSQWADRSVQLDGTWGGATCLIEGSNDGTTWYNLRDPGSVALSFTGNGFKQILEVTQFIRPRLSVAGTGAAVTVNLLVRRANPMRQ